MAIDWSRVAGEHVRRAAETLAPKVGRSRKKNGLFVIVDGQYYPAKQVLRIAYSLASGIPQAAVPKFSSGDASMRILRKLGFVAERVNASDGPSTPSV